MQNLLLAAGLGLRSEGKKLLLPYQGKTIVHHAVLASLEAGLYTIVVTGYRKQEVQAEISNLACPNLLVVENPSFAQGQGSSTICGAAFLKEDEPFFISLADMPLIEAYHYRFLADRAKEAVVRPSQNGKMGHPVLLGAEFRSIILEQKAAFTMRSLLKDDPLQAIEVEDNAYFLDIDTLDAYHQLMKQER